VVYGVVVPRADGRRHGGDHPSEGFDLAVLRDQLGQRLPPTPAALPAPGGGPAGHRDLKRRTGELAAEGFDPRRIADPLYVDDAATGAYAPLTAAVFEAMAASA